MLVCFRAENFRSIKTQIELNLRASPRLRKHKDHVRLPIKRRKNLKLLKSAVIYGANASGKSNVIKALYFFRELVVNERHAKEHIPLEPFKLTTAINEVSSFYIEFTLGPNLFGYEISCSKDVIVKEKLTFISQTTESLTVFERLIDESGVTFNTEFIDHPEERTFIEGVCKYSPKNNSFLSVVSNNDTILKDLPSGAGQIFSDVFNYFSYCIIIIFPETRWTGFLPDNDSSEINCFNLLKNFDTGVSEVIQDRFDIGIFSESTINTINKRLLLNPDAVVPVNFLGRLYKVKLLNGEPVALLTSFRHVGADGELYLLETSEESDGTQRLMDLLPIFAAPNEDFSEPITFIIDEFDRSLHPNLAKHFLSRFLGEVDRNSQLIVTTHQSELLNLDLVRRDEIWFVQKEWDHSSTLYSLDEYAVRHDKSIREAYLDGLYGAVPVFV